MIENRPRQCADPSVLKRGRERDAAHGPQSGSVSSMSRAHTQSNAKAQARSELRLLTHLT